MEMYVLHVLSGQEEVVKRELMRAGQIAHVPSELRLEHRRGSWHPRRRILFTGYVFVELEELDAREYYTAKNTCFVIGFLGKEKPEKLLEREANMIRIMSNQGSDLPTPVVTYHTKTNLHTVKWDLKESDIRLKRLFKRQRRAVFECHLAGEKHEIMLSCEFKEV